MKAFSADECDIDELRERLIAVCLTDRDAPWLAMALLDQYQRRGILDEHSAKNLKLHISRLALELPSVESSRETAAVQRPPPEQGNATQPAHSTPTKETTSTRQKPAHAGAPVVGRTLHNRYVLEELVWQSDRLFFFRARDLHRGMLAPEERKVGIKVLYMPGVKNSPELQTLQQEFRQMQSLVHPNIPRVFDMDRDGDSHFLVMEWLVGFTLSELLPQLAPRILKHEQALTLINCIGSALAHAHERSVVHGELHPDDIVITEFGEVKLQAFAVSGIATWDERSDILSLASLAYELLTGQHPFNGLTPIEARKQRAKPSWAPALSITEWRALRRALEWKRPKRTASVRELLRALGCAGSPDRLYPPAQLQAAAVARPRVGWMPAAAAVLCILAVGLGALLMAKKDNEPTDVAANSESQTQNAPSQIADAPPEASTPVNTVAASTAVVGDTNDGWAATASSSSRPSSPAMDAGQTRHNFAAVSSPMGNTQSATSPPTEKAAEGGVLSFAQDTYSIAPSEGIARLSLKRQGNTKGPVSFKWWTVAGTASPDQDFVPVKPRVEQMADGQEQMALSVPVVADSTRKKTESFEVHIGNPEGARLGTYTTAAVILVGRR